jgi:type I restriction enzyme S subunit
MRDGWTESTLGSVFQLSNRKLGKTQEEPEIFAISKYEGVVLARDYFDRRIASQSLDGYKVIGPNDWVYSTIHIDEGSIAVNHFPFAGVVSPMYTSMIWNSSQHDSRFFEYLLKSDEALIRYQENAQGSVNRRRSLSWKAFSDLTFLVPPLDEQRRIVDLVSSVDAYINALQQHFDTARTARNAVLHKLLTAGGPDWNLVPIDSLTRRSIGGVWGLEEGQDEVDVTVVRSTEFTKSGYLNFSTGVARSIKQSQLASRELTAGDILLEKSGGGPEQPVGRVVYVDADIPVKTVCSNFIQLISPLAERAVPRFLFLVMWLWHFQNKTLEFQAQTTGIRNLRTPDYLAQFVNLPPMEEQKRIVGIISSMDDVVQAAERAVGDAKSLRSGLLSSLLSGEHEIPASYDSLLGVA